MENKVNFITSEKGKPLVLLNLHKYRFIRERKDGIKKIGCPDLNIQCILLV
jgi:hypothetical protein